MLFGSLTPVSVTGTVSLGGVVSTQTAELSVITIHGGSPSPVYPSTAALLTCIHYCIDILDYVNIYDYCNTSRVSVNVWTVGVYMFQLYLLWLWVYLCIPFICLTRNGNIYCLSSINHVETDCWANNGILIEMFNPLLIITQYWSLYHTITITGSYINR